MASPEQIAALMEDKEKMKTLVVDTIYKKCISNEENNDVLKEIGTMLEAGKDTLQCEIVAGGVANYAYKVSLSKQSSDIAFFAKLSFDYVQVFPDKPCPLDRTENEFFIMKRFFSLAPKSSIQPLFVVDVEGKKLLVTLWSTIDEQWANQFIDGNVDKQCAKTIASVAQKLHCVEFEPDFNAAMRPFHITLLPAMRAIVDTFFGDIDNRVSALGKKMGKEVFDECFTIFEQRTKGVVQSLIHGDMHVFNLLVAKPPGLDDIKTLEEEEDDEFGTSNGTIIFCDWEVSHAGVTGKDFGSFFAFPIACAFAHIVNGNPRVSQNILTFLDTAWEKYVTSMKTIGGKTDDDMATIYKDALMMASLYLLCSYGFGLHTDHLPIEPENVTDVGKVKESCGIMAIKMFTAGSCASPEKEEEESNKLSLRDLQLRYKEMINKETAYLTSMKNHEQPTKPHKRRSSMLRQSGKRVSDSDIHFSEIKRLSISSADGRIVEVDL